MQQQTPQLPQPMALAAYAPGTPFEVQVTPEFMRVLNLPRRDWEEAAKLNDLYLRMTQAYKQRAGTQEMRLIQAAALADAHDMRGLFAPVRVGEGKTLLTFMLATVITGVRRPALILPSGLIKKTWREFNELKKHWICHPAFITRKSFDAHVISYEMLGRESGKDKLNELRPDLIISDETHKFRNFDAACTKRMQRFMVANPTTMFCGMSGTITKRSLKDYWHLLFWALRHHMPVPRSPDEAARWSEALDEKKTDSMGRRQPGALLQFCSTEELQAIAPKPRDPNTLGLTRTIQMPEEAFRAKLKAARQGFQRRLRDTPGVICSPNRNLDCSLIIRRLDVHPSPIVEEHLARLREEWVTPNGDLLTMPTEVWRVAREIATGFYYRWEPPPPEHWMKARSAWNWVVRQVLDPREGIYYHQFAHLNLDSPMQVASALLSTEAGVENVHVTNADGSLVMDDQGGFVYRQVTHPGRPPKIGDAHILKTYLRWREVRKDYKIKTVAQWVDDSMLRYCFDWMSRNGPAIVFVEHRAFGEVLAQMTGTGFCSQGGLDANGITIEDHAGRNVVASIAANHAGRNLQAWNKMLIVTITPTGSLAEQLIGREHRPGQKEDTVYVDWICACEEQDRGFKQMMADARYIQDSTGQTQKLLYADHC